MTAAFSPEIFETISLATEPATRRQKFVMGGIAVAAILVTAVALCFADLPLLPVVVFLPTYGTAVFLTDLMTAALLFTQLYLTRQPAQGFLAAAYLFTGLTVVARLLVFPGLYAPQGLLGAGPQSSTWLWFFWHCGFAAFVIAYALAHGAASERRFGGASATPLAIGFAVGTIGLVAGLTFLVTVKQAWLPPLIAGQSYRLLSFSIMGVVVLGLTVIALLLVIAVTRCRAVGDLGLVVAVLASLLDVVLTLRAGARFTLGWYVGRMICMLSAGSVLAVFLAQATWLYAQVVDLNARLANIARRDGLTGLANRRWFDERLEQVWRYAARHRSAVALVLLDIDCFKSFNDFYGHLAGDECLRRVGQALGGAVHRPADLAARFGGEEFVLILPDTDIDGAFHVAERVRHAVRDLAIPHERSEVSSVVTVSLGLAALVPPPGDAQHQGGWADMTRAADIALYNAKHQGRDCIAAAPVRSPAL